MTLWRIAIPRPMADSDPLSIRKTGTIARGVVSVSPPGGGTFWGSNTQLEVGR